MNDATSALALSELSRYHLAADLVSDPALPAFEVRRVHGKTVIAAPDSLELLYGVYDYAERFCGWSFFEPGRDKFDVERVKKLPDDGVIFPAVKPLLKRRGFIQEFSFDDETAVLFDWMAKNKLNYLLVWMKYYDALSAELKHVAAVRGITIESGHHNFDYWIPRQKYGHSHPEFFAEVDGSRTRAAAADRGELLLSEQLCTTNPALRREIVDNMLRYCEKHPEVNTISLNPNDGFGWCECENCAKFYDKNQKGDFYSLSEHVYKADRIYHDLLDDTASRLAEKRNDLRLTFFAYVNYCSPAPGFKLKKNLAVHMALYWRCINHTIDDPACPVNRHYAQDIRNWVRAKAGGEVNIYEYFMGVNFYLSLPMIHFEEMFREMRWYADNAVDGILTQFHLSHWSVYGMNYALMARAARGENASEALNALYEERFGGDAPAGRAFYRHIKEMLLRMGRCHIPYPYALFSRTCRKDFETVRALAEALSARAPKCRFRQSLVIWAEYMLRFKTLFDDYHAGRLTEGMLDEFLAWIAARNGAGVFVDFRKYQMYFGALRECLRTGRKWRHFNLDWEDEYIRKQEKLIY